MTRKKNYQPVAGFTWETFLIGLAWVIAFCTIVPVMLRIRDGVSPTSLGWLCFWLYFGFTIMVTTWLSNRYRTRQRNKLITAQELLATDSRPPVLYLRSFNDDETTSQLQNLSTEEQELAVTMLEIGPFIAFGLPGESIAKPGAARMYVAHEHWQAEIKDLMTKARLVVGRIANTESFWWEMVTAKELLAPSELVLLLPKHREEYEEFRRRALKVFPQELPALQFRSRTASSKSHISSEGILYFQKDWSGCLRPLPRAILRQNFWMPGVPIFKLALKPVYDQLGVKWKRPPLQPLMVLAVILLILMAVLTLYVGGLQVVKFVELVRGQL
jgi:hypothetical protein